MINFIWLFLFDIVLDPIVYDQYSYNDSGYYSSDETNVNMYDNVYNESEILEFLANGKGPNQPDIDEATLLHHAIAHKLSLELVQTLIDAGADINAKDYYDDTPLHLALSSSPSYELIECLIEAGADVNAENMALDTPLHIASIYYLSDEIINLLIEAGADEKILDYYNGTSSSSMYDNIYTEDEILEMLANGKGPDQPDDDNATLLHHALADFQEINIELVKTIIDAGADVNARDYYNDTPLHLVMGLNAYPELVELFINAGADLNAQNQSLETPLMLAFYTAKSLDIIELLLKAGADPNIMNDDNVNVLVYATYYPNSLEAIKLLQKYKVDLNATFYESSNIIHALFEAGANIDTLKYLLEQGVDVNAQDEYGYTPLMLAVSNEFDLEVIELLMAHNADIHAVTQNGYNALALAVFNNDIELTKLFLAKNVKLDLIDDEGDTVLNYAITLAYDDIIDDELINLLLDNIEDINLQDASGDTALHVAVYEGKTSIIKSVLEKNPDLTITNSYNETPLHTALYYYGETELVDILLDAIAKAGLDINSFELSPLLYAIENDAYVETIARILELTDLEQLKAKGNIPFDFLANAIAKDYPFHIIQKILEIENTVNNVFYDGLAPLDLAENKTELKNYLLSLGAKKGAEILTEKYNAPDFDVNEVDEDLYTPLHFAIVYNYPSQYIKILLDKKADVNAVTAYGDTPLLLAASYTTDPQIIEMLVNAGADVNATAPNYPGETPLYWALSDRNSKEVVEKLLDLKADSNTITETHTALMLAIEYDYPLSTIVKLVEAGADLNPEISCGCTVLEQAEYYADTEIINYLFSKGAK